MSNILEDSQLELNINANINNEALSSLDPTNDYIENLGFNNDNGSNSNSISNSNTSNTTPEFNSPDDQHFLNYNYKYDHHNGTTHGLYGGHGGDGGHGSFGSIGSGSMGGNGLKINDTIDEGNVNFSFQPELDQSPILNDRAFNNNSLTHSPTNTDTTSAGTGNGPTNSSSTPPTSASSHAFRPTHSKSASFSLPDKLNLLSLRNMPSNSSKSPSPEFMYYNKGFHDERTINPKQLISSKSKTVNTLNTQDLFGNSVGISEKGKSKSKSRRNSKLQEKGVNVNNINVNGNGNLNITGMGISTDNNANNNSNGGNGNGNGVSSNAMTGKPNLDTSFPRDYILPSSSSSPNLSSIFNQYSRSGKEMDFKMNNECVDAIRSWLNSDMNHHDKNNNEMLINPTGILKSYNYSNDYTHNRFNMISKRRNSIQLMNPTSHNLPSTDKRKRRKSSNARLHNLKEFKNSLFNLNFHDQESHEHDSEEDDEEGDDNVVDVDVGMDTGMDIDNVEMNGVDMDDVGINIGNVGGIDGIGAINDVGIGMGVGLDLNGQQQHVNMSGQQGSNLQSPILNSNGATMNNNNYKNNNTNNSNNGDSFISQGNKSKGFSATLNSSNSMKPVNSIKKNDINGVDNGNANGNTINTINTINYGPSSISNDSNGTGNKDEEGKPFPCPNCSKQFKRSEHLKRHIRSVHSNIRPFHCKYCEKQFSRSDNLAQHLKTHYKLNANGTTLIIYGNPNLHNRGGRRKNSVNNANQGNMDLNDPSAQVNNNLNSVGALGLTDDKRLDDIVDKFQ